MRPPGAPPSASNSGPCASAEDGAIRRASASLRLAASRHSIGVRASQTSSKVAESPSHPVCAIVFGHGRALHRGPAVLREPVELRERVWHRAGALCREPVARHRQLYNVPWPSLVGSLAARRCPNQARSTMNHIDILVLGYDRHTDSHGPCPCKC
eukprot:6341403-Prymnesium_polylepis.2